MRRETSNDLFDIQTRLFRMFQVKEDITAEEASVIFQKFEIFKYIETCYEEYHVQGDESNLSDIYGFLSRKGWKK